MADSLTLPARTAASSRRLRPRRVPALLPGLTLTYLGLLVLLPVGALVLTGTGSGFLGAVSNVQAVGALRLTIAAAFATALLDAVTGLALAWVLVRDEFPGKSLVNALIDLPFALPTIVAGLVLLSLYGPGSPVGVEVAGTRAAVLLALAFVTLPFVVRSVQPVLIELDREVEEAATTLGASPLTTFRRVVLPVLAPALLSGAGLAFARALGEFGSVVLISGNLPFRTQVASVYVAGQVEAGDPAGAAAVSLVLVALALAALGTVQALARRASRRG